MKAGIVKTAVLLIVMGRALAFPGANFAADGGPLASLDYRIIGTQLRVSPAAVSAPKGVAASVFVEIVGSSTNGAAQDPAVGAYVEATLRGPSFEARRVLGRPNEALMLPPLNLVGDYQVDNIRLLDAATGAVRMEGNPISVPIHIFDEVLVSRVTSRPLTSDEIKERGIVIDQQNFRAVEFEVGFVLEGKTVPVKFPVVAPAFKESTEIIPRAEVEARLAQADEINKGIAAATTLPGELQGSNLNIQVAGINFERVEGGEVDLRLHIPPIPALMVIPGNIGFLHQFFSVQIFTENAAPQDSGLSVLNVKAELILPPGEDKIASTNYSNPGDDPLRFARIGPDKIIENVQPVVRPGIDGRIGTADDILRLYPGESGQGEFLVEGLQEGLHVMNLKLTADLEGLAAGVVKIRGKAAGSVLVRNPAFSMAFSHPRTTRAGEPYDAFVTLLNTSLSPANLVSVTLSSASLSGGSLESEPTVELGTIKPGETATAKFRVRAQRTGAISFSNLTTGDDAVTGRFRLHMGVDERGVALSPDSIGMPEYVTLLPTNLVAAANRILGQALSVATAAQLPPSVKPVSRAAVTQRVLELAEAGQRLRYGDRTDRVLADLLLDWQGGRSFSAGLDQILRETEAGLEFRQAIAAEIEAAGQPDASSWLMNRSADLAGRGEAWVLASSDSPQARITVRTFSASASVSSSSLMSAAGYSGRRGPWICALNLTNEASVEWRFTNGVSRADLTIATLSTNGSGVIYRWTPLEIPSNATYSFSLTNHQPLLLADLNNDGVMEALEQGMAIPVRELQPEIVSALQDPTVTAGRPDPRHLCISAPANNYGTVLAVLFSKPMSQEQVNLPEAFRLENGNAANSVQMQPGGRVALLNMRWPVGALRTRTLTVAGVQDPRGNPILQSSNVVQTQLKEGVALKGRVIRADGTPAPGIPVTLTMHDGYGNELMGTCDPFPVRVCQVDTASDGTFDIDFVLAGMPYTISATDTAGLSSDAAKLVAEASSDTALAREKLLALADSPSVKDTLLGAFAVGALPDAIALAEGLDRAAVQDLIPLLSARQGTEIPVALRFRGRGTVSGRVLASDGATPVADAPVNLYPAPDSREMGRGLHADGDGRFAFFGVPLGVFSLQASSPAGQERTVSDLISRVGEVKNLNVVLSSAIVPTGEARGRVVESDMATPHAKGTVFIGYKDDSMSEFVAVAAVTADVDGYWSASKVPTGKYEVIAVSLDGKRKGQRKDIAITTGSPAFVTVVLQSWGTVSGRVETSTGLGAANALVAGGEALVRTDADGRFRLTGVPLGPQTIQAGLERNPAAGIDFPRLGSGSVNVLAGIDNYTVVRLRPAGRIVGRVLDANGKPVPNVRVALPLGDGFQWVDADADGKYTFDNLPLSRWTVSAPSGPTANTDTTGLVETLRTSGSEDEIMAAIGEAFAMFTGASDPYLNGEGASFNPGSWGFNTVDLRFDGETAVADIRYLRTGTISGTVLNGQGVPIGARVRLTGIGPLPTGMPGTILRGERDSDPALGTFEFPGQAFTGPWGLQAASPFYPTVITTNGQTYSTEPDATNIVIRFPPVKEVNGRLAGYVLNPDGSTVGVDVRVKISFGNDYVIRTDTNGFFDTQMALPAFEESNGGPGRARSYFVEGEDQVSGLRGAAWITMAPGITNMVQVPLLSRARLEIAVRQANGTPAAGAQIVVKQGSYPGDAYQGVSDANGKLSFENIFEGPYSISAELVGGPTKISGRGGINAPGGQTGSVLVTLGPAATIHGVFLKRDYTTPIAFAQVAVGALGFAATDAAGKFEIGGVPLGTYRLVSQDPVSGLAASSYVTLAYDGQVKEIQLLEQSRGQISGSVINSYGTGAVPGARVTLRMRDGLSPNRTVSTGPEGTFTFPDAPAGDFELSALDPVTKLQGSRPGTLGENVPLLQVSLPLQPLASMGVLVLQPDGSTPATNAVVELNIGNVRINADTGTDGRASFSDLALGPYSIRAAGRALLETRSIGSTNFALNAPGAAPDVSVVLLGVGRVEGVVLLSDGITPASAAEVTLGFDNPELPGAEEKALTDANGRFAFPNVAVGKYGLSARAAALGANYAGLIATNGQLDQVILKLGPSGRVIGKLTRSDQTNAVPGIDVLLEFQSQSGLPGKAVFRTDQNGGFHFENVPLGAFNLEAIAPDIDGLVRVVSAVRTNGQTVDLTAVALDEEDPRVLSISPVDGAALVPINTDIRIFFNEALALDSVTASGFYIRGATGNIPSKVELLQDPTNRLARLVRIAPLQPLRSQQTYEVVVIDGDRQDAFGGRIASGPRDLMGRICVAPFVSRFTTADNDPPRLLSMSPGDGEAQVDPRASIRLSFNEAIQSSNIVWSVKGPSGEVAGDVSVAVSGLVAAFTPRAALAVNSIYTVSVTGLQDVAGNAALNQPFGGKFATLDTLGPAIVSLRIGDNRKPVAGSTVPLEAVLAGNEHNAKVRFTSDLKPIGSTTNEPYRIQAALPLSGGVTFRAIATDQYGNDGPFAELAVSVVSNQAPVLHLTRGAPQTGAVASGQSFNIDLNAETETEIAKITLISAVAGKSATNVLEKSLTNHLQFIMPSDALASDVYSFWAQAVDVLGALSTEEILGVPIRDGTPPSIRLLSPSSSAPLDPTRPLLLDLSLVDNSDKATLNIILGGALALTQKVDVSLSPNVPLTNRVSIPLVGAPTNGAVLLVNIKAADAALNATNIIETYRLADIKPPRLVASVPGDGESRVSLWQSAVVFRFDEPIQNVATNSIVSANDAGVQLSYRVLRDAEDSQAIRLEFLDLPLSPGLRITNTIFPEITDLASNRWVDSSSAKIPAQGRAYTFTTAKLLAVLPTNGTSVLPGERVSASVAFEAGLGAGYFRYRLNGEPWAVVVAAQTNASWSFAIPGDATEARLAIEAGDDSQFSRPYQLAPITLNLRPIIVNEETPVLTAPATIDLYQGALVKVPISASDAKGNFRGFRFELLPETNDNHLAFSTLHWTRGTDKRLIQTIGAFDPARGGPVNLVNGPLTADLRVALANEFPLATISATNVLTREFFDAIDMLFIASVADLNKAITPLSASEQTELRRYVENGGAAILVVDNDKVEAGANAANQSLVSSFGFSATGTVYDAAAEVLVADPTASPATSGPFGRIARLTFAYPGWFDRVASNATTVARLATNNQPAVAYLPPGALTPRSGAALFMSDAGNYTNIVFNTMASVGFSNAVSQFTGELQLQNDQLGASLLRIYAFDLAGFTATQAVQVITHPIGQAPQSRSPAGAMVTVSRIFLQRATGLPRELELVWNAPPGADCAIEQSPDLFHWTELNCLVAETIPGEQSARVPLSPGPKIFIRIRQR